MHCKKNEIIRGTFMKSAWAEISNYIRSKFVQFINKRIEVNMLN